MRFHQELSDVSFPQQRYSIEEYVDRERVAPYKNEYYQGQIFAMSGGSLRHSTIGGNVFATLRNLLRCSSCRPRNSNQRVRVPANGLATYADITIVCGELQVDIEDRDAIISPCVIFEVLSRSTESYDRGKKFDLYRELESFQEYILIAQEEPQIERFVRQLDGTWNLTVLKGLKSVLDFHSVRGKLSFAEVYEDVTFGPEDVPAN